MYLKLASFPSSDGLTHFPNLLRELYNDEIAQDVTFIVENVKIKSHQAILCSVSPLLGKLLFRERMPDNINIIMSGFDTKYASVLKTVLSVLYLGTVEIDSIHFPLFNELIQYLDLNINLIEETAINKSNSLRKRKSMKGTEITVNKAPKLNTEIKKENQEENINIKKENPEEIITIEDDTVFLDDMNLIEDDFPALTAQITCPIWNLWIPKYTPNYSLAKSTTIK